MSAAARPDRSHPVSYKRLRLPALDKDAFREEATRDVAASLDAWVDSHKDRSTPKLDRRPSHVALERLKGAMELIEAESAFLKYAVPDLRETCLSYTINDGYGAIWKATGWSSTGYKEYVKEALEAGGVPYVENAHLKILDLAPKVLAARERRSAATRERNEAMVALLEAGWRQKQVAELVGVNAQCVSSIKQKAIDEKVAA